ncbi:alkylhydroperoxidase [Streptomyces sp. BE147]|uniref:alkylhydroperoxidase n=1 Tax=unclassified Streptomyces TaxID=2593676 RepID=UPI002E7677C7|nr:alkylhydroperoxidase [Streptomyces sp. BE147]MEE1736258.1 alkylhydroperoxidase [Streptomyces sp. BE147]
MRPVVRTVLRGALKQVRYVEAVPPGRARGLVAAVYTQAERDFGVLAPPLALHSPAPVALAAAWLMLRETLLVEGEAGRAAKEVTATAVSEANTCSYCVDVHRATLQTLEPEPAETEAALAAWARATGLRAADGPRVPAASAAEAAELCGVAVTFHYINRMAAVFLADSPMPDQAPGFLRGPIMRTVARSMRPVGPGPVPAGSSLSLLPSAPRQSLPGWAGGSPVVADALGRAVAAVDGAADWVPQPVRERLADRLAAWDGGPAALSTAWLQEASAGLTAPQVPVARLALLTAFAAHRITDADVAAFRVFHPTDRELVELTSWASLTTALCVGGRLAGPRPVPGR